MANGGQEIEGDSGKARVAGDGEPSARGDLKQIFTVRLEIEWTAFSEGQRDLGDGARARKAANSIAKYFSNYMQDDDG